MARLDGSYDVLIVGLGSMGAAAARTLAARGLRVLGLETFGPAHDQGSAHGGTRIVRQSYFEGPAYVPLLRRAYEGWHELAQESGRDLLRLCGGIYIGDPESPVFAGSLASARLHGLEHEVLDALADVDLARRKRSRPTLLRAGHPLGTNPRWGVEVVSSRGRYGADRLVLAPGAWVSSPLPPPVPIAVERQIFYWLEPDCTPEVPYDAYAEGHPVVLACGFSDHGFKFVPVVGEIIADLVQTGTTPHDIALFDVARPAFAGTTTS